MAIDLNDTAAAALRYDLRDIDQRLRADAANWIPGLFPNAVMQRDRRSMRCGDLTGRAPTGDGSCTIHLAGERAGTGHDFAEDKHAGPIDLIRHVTGLTGKELFARAAEIAGVRPIETTKRKPRDDKRTLERILNACAPLAGSPAVRYLEGRGLVAPDCPDLLYCNDLMDRNRQYDGLVAIVRDEKGERTGGILRIFLTDDCTAKAEPGKKMLGAVAGGAVQLAAIGDDGHLGVAEGLETSLAVMQIFAVPCWATLSTSGMKRWTPPANVRRITIFADAGAPGAAAASALSARLAAMNIEVHLREPLHGDDFNDDLQRGATMADYHKSTAVITPRDSDIIPPIGRAAPPRCYSKLLMSDREIPRPLNLLANGSLILRTEPCFDGRIRKDEFKEAIVYRDLPWQPGGDWREWEDGDDLKFAEWCQMREVPLTSGTCFQAVNVVAQDNRFHPIRDFLDGLCWDGVPRLDTWLSTYLGVDDTRYTRAVGRAWPISGVARVRDPGCKVDHILVLEGDQRIKKSSIFRVLMPNEDWFSDSFDTLGTKDAAQSLRGKWLIETPELTAFNRADSETIKAFVSRQTDNYRPSYGRRSRDFKRQCFFGGTTNHHEYLKDETGDRRAWPVRCTKIDTKAIERDRDQLWAEAAQAYRVGEQWWLTEEVEAQAKEQQEGRRIQDTWEEKIRDWTDRQTGDITMSRILYECINRPLDQQTDKDSKRVARILRSIGFEKKQVRRNGGHLWIYLRAVPA